MPLRSGRGRVFYELSSSSVLRFGCRQKTRLGKLTYLAYFLMKLYYSYSSLRSYSYKYALRKKLHDNVTTGKPRSFLLFPATVRKKERIKSNFYKNVSSGVYRSSKSYRASRSRMNMYNIRNYRAASVRKSRKQKKPDTTIHNKQLKYKYFHNTLFDKKPERVVKVSMLLRKQGIRHTFARTRVLDEKTFTRTTWSFFRIRNNMHVDAPVKKKDTHVYTSTSSFTHTRLVRAYCKRILSRSLPFVRSARYNTLRKRRWLKFTRRFFSINDFVIRSVLPLIQRPRKWRFRRYKLRYVYPRVASRVLHSFIRSKYVDTFSLTWPRSVVFLFEHLCFKFFFLYKRISHFFSVYSSCTRYFVSFSLCFQLFSLRCYVYKHCTFLSFFSSIILSTTLPFLQLIYTSLLFTFFSPLLRTNMYTLRSTCMYMLSSSVIALFSQMSIFSLRISLLHFFFLDTLTDDVYSSFSLLLFHSVRSHLFFLLRTYASFYFSNIYDSKGTLSLAYSAVNKCRALSSGVTRCIRNLRTRLRCLQIGSVLRSSGYVTLLSRRFRTSYRPKKRRSSIRKAFVTAALSVLPSYVVRSVMFLPVAQQLAFTFDTTSETVLTAQTPFRRSIRANTYSDSSRVSVAYVRRALRKALYNMLRNKEWIQRFFPVFKARRIINLLYKLFIRTPCSSSRLQFSTIRTRVWYLINQHARQAQTYAKNVKLMNLRIRRMNKKKSYLHVTQKDYSGSVRYFSLSYFLNTHYNMSVQDFLFFCKSVGKFSGSLASVLFLMERTVPLFLSNHFMINTCSGVRVNNVTFEPMSGQKGPFISVGDIIEFGCIVKQNCSSVFSPLFVILFNIVLTSRSLFFRTRLVCAIVSRIRLFLFRRKKILRVLRRRHARIPIVRSALLGTFYGVNYNSVSYFIRSRATSHTHMFRALSGKKRPQDLVDVSGRLGFVPFVQTLVRTNKNYVVEFLEIFGENGFWTIPDACLQNVFYDIVRCHVFASFTFSAVLTRCFFNDLYISSGVSTFLDKYSLRKRVTLESLLPVFLYTNYTRFILEPRIFTKMDVFMYSKRYFTFYGTAILAYKRNTEMSHFDTYRAANRFYLSHNVKKIQRNIRRKVSHNSIRSVQLSRVTQTRLFNLIRRMFRKKGRRLRFYRRRRRKLRRQKIKNWHKRTLLPVSLRTSRVVRSSLWHSYALYKKYSVYYNIPSQTRSNFSILPDSNDYYKLKIFGLTRDYYVRSANTPFINSRNVSFNSYYTGSISFKEPLFFPGVKRFFFTGGRLCSSVSFLFSKDIFSKVSFFSNSTQALLFRLDDERAVANRGITGRSRKRLFRSYNRVAAHLAKYAPRSVRRGGYSTGRKGSKKSKESKDSLTDLVNRWKAGKQEERIKRKHNNNTRYKNRKKPRRDWARFRRHRRRRCSRRILPYVPKLGRTYHAERRYVYSPSVVIMKLLRRHKISKPRPFERRGRYVVDYFGNSFHRCRRTMRRVPWRREYWRRKMRVLWRLRAVLRKTRSMASIVLPLFDNEEQTVRLLHDERFDAINSLAELQSATNSTAERSALASAFLSLYLRERLVIEHSRSIKIRKRASKRVSSVPNSTTIHETIASPVVSRKNTFTSRDFIGYQLRLNAFRRNDRANTRRKRRFIFERIEKYQNDQDNPPTPRWGKQKNTSDITRNKYSSRAKSKQYRLSDKRARVKDSIEHRSRYAVGKIRTKYDKYSVKDRANNSSTATRNSNKKHDSR